ncbi:MAG: ATP-dependent RecD-like DNA helicase [Bacteroidetes bacterium]|nr:ATP-dependent RecD-like DNA helicase [Bacteroidota bacterium]MBU2508441.1 ATP-dependent RecD-like DNA helicase [Bacteroidota bacterium]
MESLKGEILRYTYYNEENGYSVIRLLDNTTVVGVLPKLNDGDKVEFTGNWTTHPKFGAQFKVEGFNVTYPTTEAGIINYLGSGLIKGIGKSTAHKIVKVFGSKTIDIIENNIDQLLKVDGIGEKKLQIIKKGWSEQQGVKNVMLFLQGHGISTAYSIKIYKTYGERAPEVINANPYKLIQDVWGIGFKIADDIGKKLGFTEHHPARIEAGIVYALSEISKNGHTYVPEIDLINYCTQLLKFELAYSDPVLQKLEENGLIVHDNGNVYLSELFYAERSIEKAIESLSLPPNALSRADEKALLLIRKSFSDEQFGAIKSALENKLLIITGGPGTGKTTTLKGIIDIYKRREKKILLAAPTGRAAKRMTEVIGLDAKTIHRLLEYNPAENAFGYNQFNRLDCDLLIVDEVSMIDTYLMYHLITAVNPNTTVIFVGDKDQLPSVGPGNILKDLINSDKILSIELTIIFRQAEESDIVLNAHKINKGETPDLINKRNTDFVFLEESNNASIPEKILHLVKTEIPNRLQFDPFEDVQVISPMYRGDVGVNTINSLFQQSLNPSHVIYSSGERKFKGGDKIMQLRNNYVKGVFNGDIGFIINYDEENKFLNASYEGKIVKYSPDELDEITLAYAVTVHKSQGSEYPCVIMPISTAHYIMLQRNLLYTAITRASRLLILIGSKRAVAMATKNNKVENRFTSLFK